MGIIEYMYHHWLLLGIWCVLRNQWIWRLDSETLPVKLAQDFTSYGKFQSKLIYNGITVERVSDPHNFLNTDLDMSLWSIWVFGAVLVKLAESCQIHFSAPSYSWMIRGTLKYLNNQGALPSFQFPQQLRNIKVNTNIPTEHTIHSSNMHDVINWLSKQVRCVSMFTNIGVHSSNP